MNETDFNGFAASVQATWADSATCFIIELGYESCGRTLFAGPYDTVQDAFVNDELIHAHHLRDFPDGEPLITTVHVVHRQEEPND